VAPTGRPISADRAGAAVPTHALRPKSGQPHQVTIWLLVDGNAIYLVTGDRRRQWVQNVLDADPVLGPGTLRDGAPDALGIRQRAERH
jgi:hypothetical protein